MLGLEEIIGLEMISSDARVVGTVEGVGLEPTKWKALALRIGLRRGVEEVLGRKKRYFAVDKVYIWTKELEAVSDSVLMRRPVSAIGESVVPAEEPITPAGSMMGMRVICCNARFVGLVDNMIIDPEKEWTVPYLQVKLDRDAMDSLSIRHPFMSSPVVYIRTSDIKALGDMVILSVSLEELKSFLESKAAVADMPGMPSPPAHPEDQVGPKQEIYNR